MIDGYKIEQLHVLQAVMVALNLAVMVCTVVHQMFIASSCLDNVVYNCEVVV